jgi:hypothetical protein
LVCHCICGNDRRCCDCPLVFISFYLLFQVPLLNLDFLEKIIEQLGLFAPHSDAIKLLTLFVCGALGLLWILLLIFG